MDSRLLSALLIALSLITVAVPVYAGFFDFLSPQQNFLIIEDGLVDENNFLDLNDTPDSYSGQAGQFLKVNAGETALIFTPEPAGGGGANLLRTYTGLSPIFINNDSNVIALNIQPNSDWNGLFDGNNSTFYIDWQNHVNRLFSLIELDDNSSFDERYWTRSALTFPLVDENVSDDITLTNITQITNRDFSDINNRNFSELELDDNSSFDDRYRDLNKFDDPNMFWSSVDSQNPEFPHGFTKQFGALDIDSVGIFAGPNELGFILNWLGANQTELLPNSSAPNTTKITLPPESGTLAAINTNNQVFSTHQSFIGGGPTGGTIIVQKDVNVGKRICLDGNCISAWGDVNDFVGGGTGIDTNAWTEGFLESDTNAILQDVNASKKLTVDGNALFNSYVDVNGFGTGDVLSEDYDLRVGIAGPGGGGCIKIGDYEICDTGNMGSIGDLSLDNYMIFRDMDDDSNVSFMFITPGTLPRFVIPREGADFATNNFRSFILGGDLGQAQDDDIILCSANGYDKIDCDTALTGADLGVQDDAQIRGTVYVDENVNVLADVNSFRLCLNGDCITAWLDVNSPVNAVDVSIADVNNYYAESEVEGALGSLGKVKEFWNGSIDQSFDARTTSDGTDVNMTLEQTGGGDLTLNFSDGKTAFDCTPICQIGLTSGSDSSPTDNFIFIPQSTKVLTKSTSDWPTGEHIRVAYFFVPSAGFVQTNGSYVNQNWNDDKEGTDNQGDLPHIGERLRVIGAQYFKGIDGSGTNGYLSPTANNVELISTSGIVYQKHAHTVPSFDTGDGNIVLVKNWSGDAFHDITNLFDITADSTGASIGNNKYFNLVLWKVVNKSGEFTPTMINLPSGFYNTQSGAESDLSGFDDFTIPVAFNTESSTGFLVARITIKMGTTWIVASTTNLRGSSPQSASVGGVGASQVEFADNVFKLFDESDVTKELVFQLETIPTATTIIWTASTRDQNFDSPVFIDVNILSDGNALNFQANKYFGDFLGTFEGLAGSAYALVDGSRNFTGNQTFDKNITVTDTINTKNFNAIGSDVNSVVFQTSRLLLDGNNFVMEGNRIYFRQEATGGNGNYIGSNALNTLSLHGAQFVDLIVQGNIAVQANLNGLTVGSAEAGKDYRIEVVGEDSTGSLTWKEDEIYWQSDAAFLMGNGRSVYFNTVDVALSALVAGTLDINATNQINIKSDTVNLDANSVTSQADVNFYGGKTSVSDFNASGVIIDDQNVFVPLGMNICFDQDAIHGNGNDCDTAIQNTGAGLIIRG